MATGCLSVDPHTPDFKGLDSFDGMWLAYQASEWPHERVDFTGTARGRHRHRLFGDPVDSAHRRTEAEHLFGVPANARTTRCPRPQCVSLDSDWVQREYQGGLRRNFASMQRHSQRSLDSAISNPSRSTKADGPSRVQRRKSGQREYADPFEAHWQGWARRTSRASSTDTVDRQRGNQRKRRASSCARKIRRDRAGPRRWPRLCAPPPIRSRVANGCASIPTTTRHSTDPT